MGLDVAPSWQIMLITLLSVVAGYAVAYFSLASRSTRPKKPPPSPPTTETSETPSRAALAKLEADQVELFSTLEKLSTTMKRLSSRAGMRDVRDRERGESTEAPPRGAPKAELLRFYGMSGKVGPAFAQAQLDLERRNPEDKTH